MVTSYKSFFNPTNMLVVAALLALILFRHSLFPEATESTEVKQLMGQVDEVIVEMQKSDEVKNKQSEEISVESVPSQESEEVKEVAVEEVSEKTESAATEEKAVAGTADSEAVSQEASVIWQMARKAAWEGDGDTAIEQYRALIEMQPANYDAYGEMGNVMLQKGDTGGAVEAYSQAALLLGKSGYPQAAWQVMGIVARLDQGKAEELHQVLDGSPLPKIQ